MCAYIEKHACLRIFIPVDTQAHVHMHTLACAPKHMYVRIHVFVHSYVSVFACVHTSSHPLSLLQMVLTYHARLGTCLCVCAHVHVRPKTYTCVRMQTSSHPQSPLPRLQNSTLLHAVLTRVHWPPPKFLAFQIACPSPSQTLGLRARHEQRCFASRLVRSNIKCICTSCPPKKLQQSRRRKHSVSSGTKRARMRSWAPTLLYLPWKLFKDLLQLFTWECVITHNRTSPRKDDAFKIEYIIVAGGAQTD